jgi:hypothetical protein
MIATRAEEGRHSPTRKLGLCGVAPLVGAGYSVRTVPAADVRHEAVRCQPGAEAFPEQG